MEDVGEGWTNPTFLYLSRPFPGDTAFVEEPTCGGGGGGPKSRLRLEGGWQGGGGQNPPEEVRGAGKKWTKIEYPPSQAGFGVAVESGIFFFFFNPTRFGCGTTGRWLTRAEKQEQQ